METPKQLFDTRAWPSPTTFVTKPWNSLDRPAGGTRDGHRDPTGGARSDPDSASRCHGARWEISYIPYTCVIWRPHVCVHAMETVTRQAAPHMAGFQAGRHPHDGLSPRYGADAPRLEDGRSPEGTREAAEALRLADSPSRTDRGRAPRTVAPRQAKRNPRGLAAGKTVPGIGGADESCGIHARNPCRARALKRPGLPRDPVMQITRESA